MLAAEVVNIVGYLREDYRTIVGAVLSIISGELLLPCRAYTNTPAASYSSMTNAIPDGSVLECVRIVFS